MFFFIMCVVFKYLDFNVIEEINSNVEMFGGIWI